MIKLRIYFMVLRCSILLFFSASLYGDEATVKRFLREAPVAWKEVRSKFQNREFKIIKESFKVESGKPFNRETPILFAEGIMLQNENCFLQTFLSRKDGSEPVRGAHIGNRYYVAYLAERPDSTFKIEKLTARNADFPDKDFDEVPLWHLDQSLFPGFTFANLCLFDAFLEIDGTFLSGRYGGYKVFDAESSFNGEGKEIVTLEIGAGTEAKPQSKLILKLLPENNWCILEYKYESKANFDGKSEIKVLQTKTFIYDNEFFYPDKVIDELLLGGSGDRTEFSYEYVKERKLNCSECRFPAFGLDEPDGMIPNSSWLSPLLYLILFLAVATSLYFFKRFAWSSN